MSMYDTSNPLQCEQAKTRLAFLIKKGAVVELTEKKARRTNRQNAYLHAILCYFGCEVGQTKEYVKQNYFKLHCNKDLFVCYEEDELIGKTRRIRSSSELDTGEMAQAIERFRNWASSVGYYIPSPDDERMIQIMEIEVSRNRMYI